MKKYRKAIWSRALPLMAIAITLALSSCTNEQTALSTPGGDRIEVRVTFPQNVVSKAPTTGGTEIGKTKENQLDHVTILIFNQDGSKLESVLSEDVRSSNTSLGTTQPKWASDQTLIVRPIINPKSPKLIYAIANWSQTSFDQATYTEAMLKEELTTMTAVADINDAKAYPMLMCGSKAVADLAALFYNVTVDMERQASKITARMTIDMATQNLLPNIEWQIDLMTITVTNVPNKSYIVGRKVAPSGVTLLNSGPIAVDNVKPTEADRTIPATKDLDWIESIYITENPVTGATTDVKAKSTYIVVQLPYKNLITGTINADNYYKLYINDTRDAASPHKVLRNTIYNFNIRILGIGLPINNLVPDVNVDDELTVNSWEKGGNVDVDVDAPTNHFFKVDRTTFVFQSSEVSLQSTIATDVTDWKLVKKDGSTIFSFAEGKIATAVIDGVTYTLSGNASAATITVAKGAVGATSATQEMFFKAKNLRVPFIVVNNKGFIPNSALTAAGWPADKLPAVGLQVAMRGNGILPGGTPAADDPTKQWKTTDTATPGVESVTKFASAKLGMGKSSTDAMIADDIKTGAKNHPAAQYCRAMGPEWYLPSLAELDLIYRNKSLLDASYSFIGNLYWSATGNNSSGSWNVYFSNGSMSYITKTGTYRVRCVREI